MQRFQCNEQMFMQSSDIYHSAAAFPISCLTGTHGCASAQHQCVHIGYSSSSFLQHAVHCEAKSLRPLMTSTVAYISCFILSNLQHHVETMCGRSMNTATRYSHSRTEKKTTNSERHVCRELGCRPTSLYHQRTVCVLIFVILSVKGPAWWGNTSEHT